MTGNLNASVQSNPAFPGYERHLLRAMLARIFHATQIAPKGQYEMAGEEDQPQEIKLAEEFTMPGNDELKALDVWGNALPAINLQGTTTLNAPAGMDDDAAEAWKARMETEDPAVEAFRGITEMKGMPGVSLNPEEERCWLAKACGDAQQYTLAGEEGGSTTLSVNVFRSCRWPGAVTV